MEWYLQNFSNNHTSKNRFHGLNKGVGSTEMNKDTYCLVFPQFRVHMEKKDEVNCKEYEILQIKL